MELDAQARVTEVRVADERLVLVVDVALPPIVRDPREGTVRPDSEAARVADGVVLETNVWVVDVAEGVGRVEGDEEVAVAQW